MTKTTDPLQLDADYRRRLAACEAKLQSLRVERAAAIRPDAAPATARRLSEILTAGAVEEQLQAGLAAAIEELAPAVRRARQAQLDAEHAVEREALKRAKTALIEPAREIDQVADRLVQLVAGLAVEGAALGPRMRALNEALYSSDHLQRGANSNTLSAITGRSTAQSLAIRHLVARLLAAADHPKNLDDFVMVNRAPKDLTFEDAHRGEAEHISKMLRL